MTDNAHMKKSSNLLLCCLMGLSTQSVLSTTDNFQSIKDQINAYENSVIKDFVFKIPENIHQDLKKQMKLGIQLEEEFHKQNLLFYSAEEGLFQIEDSLDEKVEKGILTQDEASNLLTSVEYARRIILYTRKTEVHSKYYDARKKLTISPNIEKLYRKIAGLSLPGDCKIQNTKFSSEEKRLSFDITGTDSEGKQQTNTYAISQSEIDRGLLTTRFEKSEHLGTRDKMILRFNKTNEDESVSSFSLFKNLEGEFYHAEFFHDYVQKPFINIFGLIKIGSRTIDKEIRCFKGPRPASLESKIMIEAKKKKF